MDPIFAKAMQHFAARRFAEAKPLLVQAVRRDPQDARAVSYLTQCLAQLNELEQAEYFGARMTRLSPDAAIAWTYYAKILQSLNRLEESSAAATRGLQLAERQPYNQVVFTDLVWVSAQINDYVLGLRAVDLALRANPADIDVILQRAHHLGHLGRLEESRRTFEAAAVVAPQHLGVLHGLAWQSVYDPDLSPDEVFARHRAAGAAIEAAARRRHGAEVGPDPSPDPRAGIDRPLRLGILSSDLRRHSCAYFIRPILAHAAETGCDVRVYSTSATRDDFTDDLRSLMPAEAWHDLSGQTIPQRVLAVRADRPDVLVCCSGLYVDESMATLALRPCAVQVDYMGYPHTTGLPSADFRLVDARTDPPGTADAHAIERLLRLDPCFLAYAPARDAPAVRPRDPARPVTFVSFNNAMKHNDATLAAWAKILYAAPDARLTIKTRGLEHATGRDDLLARFRAVGAPLDRIDLAGWTKDRTGHMARYHDADIALDPFPYHGTTTTCEALLMGVPVVTLAGPSHASRVGVSLLSAVGVPELIAPDAGAYVTLAADLAGRPARLAEYRATLRARLLASPVCDGAGLARRLGDSARAAHAARVAASKASQP